VFCSNRGGPFRHEAIGDSGCVSGNYGSGTTHFPFAFASVLAEANAAAAKHGAAARRIGDLDSSGHAILGLLLLLPYTFHGQPNRGDKEVEGAEGSVRRDILDAGIACACC